MYEITYLPRGGSLPYIERQAIDVEYGELTTRWSYSHARSPPLAEAATPPEVVAQYVSFVRNNYSGDWTKRRR